MWLFLLIAYFLLGIGWALLCLSVTDTDRWNTLSLTAAVWLWIFTWPLHIVVGLVAMSINALKSGERY